MNRDDWVAEFVSKLRELRPEVGLNFANLVALSEWAQQQGIDPAVAAKRWVAKKGK